MADPTEGRDPEGLDRGVTPGGRSSRGPNPDPGGEEEPGGLVPPYEGRSSGTEPTPSSEALAASVERQLADTKTGAPGQTASPADEQPVSEDELTDEVPESPKGVGPSSSRSAEDVADSAGKESGRHHAGTQGESGRSMGVSDERDITGVDP